MSAETGAPHNARRTLKHYWQISKRYPKTVASLLICIPIAAILGSTTYSYLISKLIETLSHYDGQASAHDAFVLLAWLAATETAQFILWRTNGFLYITMQARAMRDLEQFAFGRTIHHSYRFFVSRFGGAIVTQFNRWLRSYENLSDVFIFEIYTMVTRIVAAIVVLTYLSPIIGLSFLAWVALFVASIIWMTRKKMPLSRREAAGDSRVTADLADAVTNVLNIKIFARRRFERQRFNITSDRRFRLRLKSWYWDEWIRAYQAAVMVAFELLLLWISIRLIQNGEIAISTVLLAQLYMSRIFGDLWNLSGIMRRVERAFSDATELTDILDLPVEVADPAEPEPLNIKDGAIEFKNVSFRYEEDNNLVLKDFNLKINAGEKVGLVGHSGSGKTTLTKLILRFADIEAGAITIDGQNIATIAQEDLRSAIAYVPQEPILFHRSLMENIRYGRLDATDEEVYDAARLAHADEFINRLPDGYDTLVGERGVKLSGGEKQRVAIARAMLSRAPILLLDEATSALDSKSEGLIAEALDRLMKGRTTIVIAHRLSTIRRLDRIIVMDRGQLVEEGKHDQLLKKSGVYAELWNHQTGGFISE